MSLVIAVIVIILVTAISTVLVSVLSTTGPLPLDEQGTTAV